MKIGLFSGVFDPIHYGHLKLAKSACSELNLDAIYFIPTATPPHKKNLTPIHHRYKMLKIAISGNEKFKISRYEMKKTVSYSQDTIKHFGRIFKNDEIFFIIGADSLCELKTWKGGTSLLDLCKFVVGIRPKVKIKNIPKKIKQKVIFLKSEMLNISANEIRKKIKNKENIKHLLPQKVIDYITAHKLYQ